MFENYKILLLESKFDGKINISYNRRDDEISLSVDVDNTIRAIRAWSRRFVFDIADIREYFSNFSFDVNEFKENNRIIPVYDFDLIMEINIDDRLVISPAHPGYLGGFFFQLYYI